jgi:hypothetical protein
MVIMRTRSSAILLMLPATLALALALPLTLSLLALHHFTCLSVLHFTESGNLNWRQHLRQNLRGFILLLLTALHHVLSLLGLSCLAIATHLLHIRHLLLLNPGHSCPKSGLLFSCDLQFRDQVFDPGTSILPRHLLLCCNIYRHQQSSQQNRQYPHIYPQRFHSVFPPIVNSIVQ